jgi:hypothetical protein
LDSSEKEMTLSISMIVGEGTPNWDALFAKVMVSKVDMFPTTDSAKSVVDMFPRADILK